MQTRLFERRRIAMAERAHRPGPFHPELPIEQTLRGLDDSAKVRLTQLAWQEAAAPEDALLVAEHDRVRALARSEPALSRVVARIVRGLEGRVHVRPPAVRYLPGNPVLEPWMTVVASGPERYLPLVQKDMARRRGRIVRARERAGTFVLEAEAPLAELLGYTAWLGELTEEALPHASAWLSRYLPVADGGPYAA
jgi:hypothetical protein